MGNPPGEGDRSAGPPGSLCQRQVRWLRVDGGTRHPHRLLTSIDMAGWSRRRSLRAALPGYLLNGKVGKTVRWKALLVTAAMEPYHARMEAMMPR